MKESRVSIHYLDQAIKANKDFMNEFRGLQHRENVLLRHLNLTSLGNRHADEPLVNGFDTVFTLGIVTWMYNCVENVELAKFLHVND